MRENSENVHEQSRFQRFAKRLTFSVFAPFSFDATLPPPMENHTYATHQLVVNVRLEINGGPLGITLSGSEDSSKPILISAIIEGGIAEASRQILIGDCLLAINGESVQGKPLSHATKLLQNLGNIVDLKISRNINGTIFRSTLDSLANNSQHGFHLLPLALCHHFHP